MPGLLRIPAVLLCVVCLPLLLVACDGETCAGACAQYYGSGEGQCNQQSTNQPTGTTQVEAESDCVNACQDALYTTSSADESGSIGGVTLMSNETDALDFIHCVVDKDFTGAPTQNPGADTCEQLSFDCERLRLW